MWFSHARMCNICVLFFFNWHHKFTLHHLIQLMKSYHCLLLFAQYELQSLKLCPLVGWSWCHWIPIPEDLSVGETIRCPLLASREHFDWDTDVLREYHLDSSYICNDPKNHMLCQFKEIWMQCMCSYFASLLVFLYFIIYFFSFCWGSLTCNLVNNT